MQMCCVAQHRVTASGLTAYELGYACGGAHLKARRNCSEEGADILIFEHTSVRVGGSCWIGVNGERFK